MNGGCLGVTEARGHPRWHGFGVNGSQAMCEVVVLGRFSGDPQVESARRHAPEEGESIVDSFNQTLVLEIRCFSMRLGRNQSNPEIHGPNACPRTISDSEVWAGKSLDDVTQTDSRF